MSKGAKFILLRLLGSHIYFWFWILRNLLALMGMLANPNHLVDFCRIASRVWWINTLWKCSVNHPVPETGLCDLYAHSWAKRTILWLSCWRLGASALLTPWCISLRAIIILSFFVLVPHQLMDDWSNQCSQCNQWQFKQVEELIQGLPWLKSWLAHEWFVCQNGKIPSLLTKKIQHC